MSDVGAQRRLLKVTLCVSHSGAVETTPHFFFPRYELWFHFVVLKTNSTTLYRCFAPASREKKRAIFI